MDQRIDALVDTYLATSKNEDIEYRPQCHPSIVFFRLYSMLILFPVDLFIIIMIIFFK